MSDFAHYKNSEAELELRYQDVQAQQMRAEELFHGYAGAFDDDELDAPEEDYVD